MLLRRTALIAATALAFACEPSVPHGTNPSSVDVAAFDLTPGHPDIPLPNDLALLQSSVDSQTGAQKELLQEFQKAGGFPNDQEVPITIDFVHETIDPATGQVSNTAPALDVSSINGSNLVVLSLSPSSFGAPVAFDAPTAADYVTSKDHGTLTLHKSPNPATRSRRFASGPKDPTTYVVAVRGGVNGVKVTGSTQGLSPSPAMFLLLQGQNLNRPENQTLIPGNTVAEKKANAALLEQLRKQYQFPLAVIDGVFPHTELAVMSTFAIAPNSSTHVETDPGAGQIPLPSDFLLDPATGGKTVVNNPAFGPLAAGIATLDGFSTTAMILSQVSAPILADSVKTGVFLYELNLKSSPPTATRLADVGESLLSPSHPRARFVAEPPQITQTPPGTTTALSTAIGLQPAVPVPLPAALGGGLLTLPPLKEGTQYAVIITNKVKDLNGQGLGRSTLGKLLLFQNALSVNGKSAVPGLDDGTAGGLEQMRQVLKLPIGTLVATNPAITKDNVVMAYTFRTQTFSTVAVQLAAAIYNPALPAPVAAALANPVRSTTVAYCDAGPPACAGGNFDTLANKYGVDRGTLGLDNQNLAAVVETVILTLNTLNPETGAAQPDPLKWTPEAVPVLMSVPNLGCTPSIPCPLPLAVFRHGINGQRTDALNLMNQFAAKGIAVVAIDASKHGARSFCSADTDCIAGAVCQHDPAMARQGDAPGKTPGKCAAPAGSSLQPQNGTYFLDKKGTCGGTGCPNAIANAGTPAASGKFVISGNLFRTRDTFRQDILDQSQVLHVVARDPRLPQDAAAELFNLLYARFGVFVDPRATYYVDQSLGAINGTIDVAANPRFSKAVLNVGGGTIVDTFAQSPSLSGDLNALLAGLGIAPGTPGYLQFLNVAKWILDPADPINFAEHLTANTLPNLLPPLGGAIDGSIPQTPKKVLGQIANCDGTVPNPFNYELFNLIGLGPDAAGSSTGTLQFFHTNSSSGPCPAGAVPHGFLINFTIPNITVKAQSDAASFLNGTAVPLDEHP